MEQILLQWFTGMMTTMAINQMVRLDLPELLANEPQTCGSLAKATDTHPAALKRLLRVLVALHVLSEEGDLYGTTELSELLRKDQPMHDIALLHGAFWQWHVWERLPWSLIHNKPCFDEEYGESLWDFFRKNAFERDMFHRSLEAFDALSFSQPLEYEFPPTGHVIDVGGGRGKLLAAILTANPCLQGTLFDRGEVLASPHDKLAEVIDRCTIMEGDFFISVPAADYYLLRQIIKDWDDEACLKILRNCRNALRPGGKCLIIEVIIEKDGQLVEKLIDLQLLLLQTGQERTLEEYTLLFEQAGFHLSRIIPLKGSPYSIMELE